MGLYLNPLINVYIYLEQIFPVFLVEIYLFKKSYKNILCSYKNKVKRRVFMPNDVVKYHNDLNMVSMRNWTAEDMNFFFAIISKIRDLGTE